MSSLYDFAALFLTAAAFAGTIIGIIYVSRIVSDGVKSTKEALKNKGLDISDQGVKVKTNKRFDRDDYVDATQRGFIKAMGAASFTHGPQNASPSGSPITVSTSKSAPAMQRSVSDSQSIKSTASSEEKKKRGLLKRR